MLPVSVARVSRWARRVGEAGSVVSPGRSGRLGRAPRRSGVRGAVQLRRQGGPRGKPGISQIQFTNTMERALYTTAGGLWVITAALRVHQDRTVAASRR
jgi:hypothetical protein